jgi:hypothetical protein
MNEKYWSAWNYFNRCSLILFIFALEYIIRHVEGNDEGFDLNGRHQLMINADYVNIKDENINDIKNDIKTMLETSTEVGTEIYIDTLSIKPCLAAHFRTISKFTDSY